MSATDQEEKRSATRDQSSGVGSLATKVLSAQLCLFLMSYFLTPGYFVPFLNNFYSRIALLALLAWEAVGFVVLKNSRALPTFVVIGLFFVPLALAPICGPTLLTIGTALITIDSTEGKGSVTGPEDVGGADEKEVVLNQTIRGSTMSVHFDRATFTNSVGGLTSSPDATFIIVQYSVCNETGSRLSFFLNDGILISVADRTVFQPDSKATFALRRDLSFLELQPGIWKNVSGVFEMPLKQLKNDPEFYISRETNSGSVSLFPKSIAPVADKTVSSENKNQVDKNEEEPLKENTPDGAKADSPTEVLNKAKAVDDHVSDSSKLVDQLLQSQKDDDEKSFNKTLSELKALSKPNVGNTVEATHLNKLGVEELKDQNYEHAAFQFDAAVKADPSEAKYLSNLGYAETYNGDLDSAWKHLCLSIQLDPSRSVAWGDLGILLAKQGNQEKSVSAFLIGDKVVEGGTRDFLEHLVSNKANDATVREASALALERLKKTSRTDLAGH